MKTTFKIIRSPDKKILEWCRESFGSPMSSSEPWDTYINSTMSGGHYLINCRFFVFYSEEDAMAFKLKWIEWII